MPTILALFLISAVHAQAPDDGLDLARLAGSECGPDCSLDEVAAIRAVCLARCRGCRTSTAVRRVSPRFFSGRTVRRHWLSATRSGARPAAWPVGAPPWERFRASWLSLVAVADAVVAGDIRPPCVPQAWGSPRYDRERIERLGDRLVPLDCGDTRNAFFAYRR